MIKTKVINILLPQDPYSIANRKDFQSYFINFALKKNIQINFFKDSNFFKNTKESNLLLSSSLSSFQDQDSLLVNESGSVRVVLAHEPRHILTNKRFHEGINVINMYTDNIYSSCFHYLTQGHLKLIHNLQDIVAKKSKTFESKVVQLSSYHQWMIDQEFEYDLVGLRNKIAIYGANCKNSNLSQFSLFGRGWPAGVKVEMNNRSESNWAELKYKILQEYYFNVALENTYWPYYVTEKLWDSLACGLLPVYKGSEWLDKLFYPGKPPIIDTRNFASELEIFEAILATNKEEYERIFANSFASLEKIKISCINTSKVARFNTVVERLLSLVL